MNSLKFEVGRFYKCRDGRKCICLATNAEGSQPNLMTETNEDGTISPRTFSVSDDGRFWPEMMRGQSSRDIISEWVDAPIVNWPAMPAWVTHVAMDSELKWNGFIGEPIQDEGFWISMKGQEIPIPPDYAPKFARDWKDSLAERPK